MPARPDNFIFFGQERERITESSFLENRQAVGCQIKYTWRELEPERDQYEFGALLKDLAFLERHGKRLFVQLQDVSFGEDVPVPTYLQKDPSFCGGADRKYQYEGEDESKEKFDGWVARRWDPAVRARFIKLLDALGNQGDGRIEGICLPETAIGMSETSKQRPAGFTYQGYVDGLKETMTAAHKAFPRSCVIEYANFMPGEFLPWNDRGYLRANLRTRRPHWGRRRRAGLASPPETAVEPQSSADRGTPSNDPSRAGRARRESRRHKSRHRKTRHSGRAYRFAKDRLRLTYIFWGTQEPFYSRDILPFIRGLGQHDVR